MRRVMMMLLIVVFLTATSTVVTDTTFDFGDCFTITAPSLADATLADVLVTLRARFT